MREHGIDISGHRSKHLEEFAGQRFGYVITLCDRVREVCPEFPGHPQLIHRRPVPERGGARADHPGPVVQTVSAVGYAAAGLGGGLLAALVAFSPSFVFVLAGAGYFSVLRTSRVAQAFLDGAGPATIGAILGSAILLAGTLREPWQFAVLAGAAVLLLGPALPVVRHGVVLTLLAAAATGLLVALAGGPLPH
jgi:hypothetical protein